jgi:hypothetical protein
LDRLRREVKNLGRYRFQVPEEGVPEDEVRGPLVVMVQQLEARRLQLIP